MTRYLKIINVVFRLFLGGMLFYGGVQKFSKPIPAPTQMVEKVKKGEEIGKNVEELKIRNYIFGMKQTNYFWQVLGIAELLCGILLISQVFGFLGAVMAVPITLHIFLFHAFLEPHEVGELIETAGLFIINIWLIAFEYKNWKHLVYRKPL